MYSINCTLYIVQCTIYTVHCTLYIVFCTLYNVQCTLFIISCSLCSEFTEWSRMCQLRFILDILWSLARSLPLLLHQFPCISTLLLSSSIYFPILLSLLSFISSLTPSSFLSYSISSHFIAFPFIYFPLLPSLSRFFSLNPSYLSPPHSFPLLPSPRHSFSFPLLPSPPIFLFYARRSQSILYTTINNNRHFNRSGYSNYHGKSSYGRDLFIRTWHLNMSVTSKYDRGIK